jgi:hypothetical protein
MKSWNWVVALAATCVTWSTVQAEGSDDVVSVGVHNDISDISEDTIGMGSVEAARTAAEDINGSGKNIKVEIVYADHQNKADVGSAIARKWLDIDKVDAIGMPAATPSSRPRSSAFRRAEDASVPAVHQRRARHGAEGRGGPVADETILLGHGSRHSPSTSRQRRARYQAATRPAFMRPRWRISTPSPLPAAMMPKSSYRR